jgi:hypothetical protein
VFIGHNLGGILVAQVNQTSMRLIIPTPPALTIKKQTMLHSFLQSDRYSTPCDIFDAVRGIVFFGTPHQGLNVDDLKDLVAMQTEKDNNELSHLLDQLNNESEYLRNQKEDCISMWEQFTGKICSFYENSKTETVANVSLPKGHFPMI